jgi:hypothetical protein
MACLHLLILCLSISFFKNHFWAWQRRMAPWHVIVHHLHMKTFVFCFLFLTRRWETKTFSFKKKWNLRISSSSLKSCRSFDSGHLDRDVQSRVVLAQIQRTDRQQRGRLRCGRRTRRRAGGINDVRVASSFLIKSGKLQTKCVHFRNKKFN